MWHSRPPRDPPPLHGKCHLKFPFWFFDYLPKLPNWRTGMCSDVLPEGTTPRSRRREGSGRRGASWRWSSAPLGAPCRSSFWFFLFLFFFNSLWAPLGAQCRSFFVSFCILSFFNLLSAPPEAQCRSFWGSCYGPTFSQKKAIWDIITATRRPG